jgi:ribose transport system ATP-binding protein
MASDFADDRPPGRADARVDVGARQMVFRHIDDVAAKGATVLCASSDYEQLATICSRVIVFHEGRVAATLTKAEISKATIAEHCLNAGS